MTNSQLNGSQTRLLAATAAGNGIGDLSLGSLQSRAAARSLIAAREATGGEGILFRSSVMANPVAPGTRCHCRVPASGQVAICKCLMPSAITKGLS
jgi:hypothetical protein